MSDEDDPEVLADLELREHTARTRPRVSDAQFAAKLRDAAVPRIIDKVPCRARCGRMADWTEEAQDAYDTFNRKLLSMRDAELDKSRIVFCDECRKRGVAMRAEDNRKHVDLVAAKIRALKATTNPDEERQLIKELHQLHHPDMNGLVEAIRQAREKQSSGKRVRGSDLMR